METPPYFSSVHDPRVVGRCKHKLSDILMVALIAYLCGGEDYSDMYQLCRYRGEEFKPLLELPNGCPSEETFERVMQAVHPDEIAACLEVSSASRTTSSPSRCADGNVAYSPTTSRKSSDFDAEALHIKCQKVWVELK